MAATFNIIRGDTIQLNLTVANGSLPQTLDGATLIFSLKRSISDTTYELQKSIGSGIVVTDSAGGLATITISAAECSSLSLGHHFWDVQVTLPTNQVYTIDSGKFNIIADVSV